MKLVVVSVSKKMCFHAGTQDSSVSLCQLNLRTDGVSNDIHYNVKAYRLPYLQS